MVAASSQPSSLISTTEEPNKVIQMHRENKQITTLKGIMRLKFGMNSYRFYVKI